MTVSWSTSQSRTVEVALTVRRHIDLMRVAASGC